MKHYLSPAIIMRIKDHGESDLLVTFLSPQKGLLRGIAKGARRSRKRFINCLEIFAHITVEFSVKREEGLCFLHSGKLINAHSALRSDFLVLSRASFMVELTEALFPSGISEPGIFDLLKDSFEVLCKGESCLPTQLLFEARAMALGGYQINLERCVLCKRPYQGEGMAVFLPDRGGIGCLKCLRSSAGTPLMRPESVKALGQMQSGEWRASGMTPISEETLLEIKEVLRLHRDCRVEKRLKACRFLES